MKSQSRLRGKAQSCELPSRFEQKFSCELQHHALGLSPVVPEVNKSARRRGELRGGCEITATEVRSR